MTERTKIIILAAVLALAFAILVKALTVGVKPTALLIALACGVVAYFINPSDRKKPTNDAVPPQEPRR